MVLGKNVFIYAGSSSTTPIIAAAKSCSLSRKCDVMERASSTQNASKEYVAGRDEWEMTVNHLVTTANSASPFAGIIKVGGTYAVSMTIGGKRMSGQAICTQADLSGAVGTLAQGSVKFKGTGQLIYT